jgi:hypothetical protein
MVAFNKFDSMPGKFATKQIDLANDSFKVMLTNTAPVSTNAVKTDITEIAAGGGYNAGGLPVGTIANTNTGGIYKFIANADSVLTATGAVAAFRYAVLYDATTNDLLGWWDRGASVSTMNTPDTFTVDLDQVNGMLWLQ